MHPDHQSSWTRINQIVPSNPALIVHAAGEKDAATKSTFASFDKLLKCVDYVRSALEQLRVDLSTARNDNPHNSETRVLAQTPPPIVLGLSLQPFGIAESLMVLTCFQSDNLIYVPLDGALPLASQLLLLQDAQVEFLVYDQSADQLLHLLQARALVKRKVQFSGKETEFLPGKAMQLAVISALDTPLTQPLDPVPPSDPLMNSVTTTSAAITRPRQWNDDALYVLYTSGTTGKPRGIIGSRQGVRNRIEWMWKKHPFASDERVLRGTRLSFVDSVAEILGTLLAGVPLVHLDFGINATSAQVRSVVLHQIPEFAACVKKWQITRLTLVPSVLFALIRSPFGGKIDGNSGVKHQLDSLRFLLVSGEALPVSLLGETISLLPKITLLNLYGSTEVSGDVTCYAFQGPFSTSQLERWHQFGVPIGSIDDPCSLVGDTKLKLVETSGVDTKEQDQRVHTRGECFVKGSCVMLGYVSYTEETSKGPDKWFAMGDTCQIIDDELFFVSRNDDLVKIRGQRVSLVAVERMVASVLSELTQHPISVTALAVTNTEPNTRLLVAFVVLNDKHVKHKTVRQAPKEWLSVLLKATDRLVVPSYSVPDELLLIESHLVPTLANGKTDRQMLSNMYNDYSVNNRAARRFANGDSLSTDEQVNAMVWEYLTDNNKSSSTRLSIERQDELSIEELGSNSLQTILLLGQIQRKWPLVSLQLNELSTMPLRQLKRRLHQIEPHLHQQHPLMAASPPNQSTAPSKRPSRDRAIDTYAPSLKRLRPASPSSSLADSLVWVTRCNRGSTSSVIPMLKAARTTSLNLPAISECSMVLTLHLSWQANLSKCIDASPLVVIDAESKGRTVLIGSHSGEFACVDLCTGRECWRSQLDDRVEASASFSVKHQLVYVGTYAGTLYALHLTTGQVQWTYQTQDAVKSSALVVDQHDLVFVGSYDHHFYALNSRIGDCKCQLNLGASVFATPVFSSTLQRVFCACTNGKVFCLLKPDEEAGDCWTIEWTSTLSAPVFSSLALQEPHEAGSVDGGLLFVGCVNGCLFALHTTDGSVKWQLMTEKSMFSCPTICILPPHQLESFVLIGSYDGCVYCVHSSSGQVKWKTNLHESSIFGSCFLCQVVESSEGLRQESEELLRPRGMVYCVTTTNGTLCFGDACTGKLLTKFRELKPNAPLFSSPVVVDQKCLVASRNDWLYALEISICVR